jgi:tRNA wybutosine-synthesizing protein 3
MELLQKSELKKPVKKFLNQKKQALSKSDKSAKKSIDEKAREVVEAINNSAFMFTTSSCSGRAILMKETGKKQKQAIIKAWHERISKNELLEELKKIELKKLKNLSTNTISIYFKFEPPIYHVICFDCDIAATLVNAARQVGFKKSGFYYGKRGFPIAELRGSEEISLPIFHEKILVDEKYLSLLTKEVNKKFLQVWKKQRRLVAAIKKLSKKLSNCLENKNIDDAKKIDEKQQEVNKARKF